MMGEAELEEEFEANLSPLELYFILRQQAINRLQVKGL